jgi:hypothetical protein
MSSIVDECGNPAPIPFPALPFSGLPTNPIDLATLIANLLGLPNLPTVTEPTTPCPMVIDAARAAGGV